MAKPRGLKLTDEQRNLLSGKLQERFGTYQDIAEALNAVTGGRIAGQGTKPLNSQAVAHIFCKGARRPRSLQPEVAHAMYEVLERSEDLQFLEEVTERSNATVELTRLDAFERDRKSGSYGTSVDQGYRTLFTSYVTALDRAFSDADPHRRLEMLGDLEDTVKKYGGTK